MAEKFAANQMLCPNCGDCLDLERGDIEAGAFSCPTCRQSLSMSDFYDFRLEIEAGSRVRKYVRSLFWLGGILTAISAYVWFLAYESRDIPMVSWLMTLGGAMVAVLVIVVIWAALNLPHPRFTTENCVELKILSIEKRNFERNQRLKSARENARNQ